MSRRFRKSKEVVHGDIKLDQFANSLIARRRIKKAQRVIRFETDVDSVRASESSDDNHEIATSENIVKESSNYHKVEGQTYPLDFWFTLSDYISPECVGKFALLCHDAYLVTRSAVFYKRLWERYKPKSFLNKPEAHRFICNNIGKSLVRRKSFCPNVIRGLHYFVPRYQSKSATSFANALDNAEGAQCVMQWHKLHFGQCIFNFKMKFPPSLKPCPNLNYRKNADIWYNPEDGYFLLQIVCKDFMDLSRSQIGGLTLTKTNIKLSRDMTTHKITLVFHETRSRLKPIPITRYSELTGNVVVLCSVLTLQLLQWWHSSYPFHNIKNS